VSEAYRQRVVAEARSWLRTPYRYGSQCKGTGADCVTFITAVFEACGLVSGAQPFGYSFHWHLGTDDEAYLREIARFFDEIAGPPRPADLVLWKFGRVFAHGGIVIEWPLVIHALASSGVQLDDALRHNGLACLAGKPRPRKFFTLRLG
jgi:cell wall-associated NlpC family hydrolase